MFINLSINLAYRSSKQHILFRPTVSVAENNASGFNLPTAL